MLEKIPGNVQEDSGECFQSNINESHVLLKKKQMLIKFRRPDLSLLYIMKQQKDQTKWSDIFIYDISCEIQTEKKLLDHRKKQRKKN